MVLFGLDVSHHQGSSLDFAAFRREGIEYVILKATEGSGFVDSQFSNNLVKARAAGLLVAAYHYVRSNVTPAAQVANVKRVVPPDVPVIPDVEANSGTVMPHTTDFVGQLRANGFRVPAVYIPRWYWNQLGNPVMAGFGLPPLWSSRYPDNVVGSLGDEYADVPAHYWNGYGGLDVVLLQFTSSARVAGRSPLDGNAFLGTREELAALFGYGVPLEGNMRNLIIGEEPSGKVWVGDGILRRHVTSETELADLRHWITASGGNATVNKPWANVPVLGLDVAAKLDLLSDDEINIVTAIQSLPGPTDIDEAALAAALGPVLAPLIQSGATPEQVEAAIRAVFADAAQPDSTE